MTTIQTSTQAPSVTSAAAPDSSVRKPNFLVIGAAKSGTTSLWAYLNQHPDVFLPRNKEPNYFALAGQSLPRPGPASPEVLFEMIDSYSITDYDRYLDLFAPARNQKALGEASVRNLYFPEAPGRIKEKLPDVRLVAILREPVSRLYSHYCMMVQFQLESLGLREAIAAEESRRRADWGWDWHYVAVSSYAAQIKRYLQHFDREQIKVFLYDDFLKNPTGVFQEVCRHVGVDDRFVPDMSQREKVAYRPKNLALDRWLHRSNPSRGFLQQALPGRLYGGAISRLKKWNRGPVPKIDPALRDELRGLFREDVRQLEDLLQRRIPWYR